jgi:hypothetical protein
MGLLKKLKEANDRQRGNVRANKAAFAAAKLQPGHQLVKNYVPNLVVGLTVSNMATQGYRLVSDSVSDVKRGRHTLVFERI